jgi:hypothetical protein
MSFGYLTFTNVKQQQVQVMKKFLITHSDGEQQVITSRFTKKEIAAIAYAVDLAFGDLEVFKEDKELEIQKLRDVIIAKCDIRGTEKYSEIIRCVK